MAREFRDLADEYAGRVFTFARYSLRHREDAEDVTQEVLLRLWKHHGSIEPASIPTWVMRVARNLVVDVARRRRTARVIFADGMEATELASDASAPVTTDAVEDAELRQLLESSLAQLDDPYRSIVVMREIHGRLPCACATTTKPCGFSIAPTAST